MEDTIMNTEEAMDLAEEIMDLGKVSEETKGTVAGAESVFIPHLAEPG
jgi:hypothetical protein